MIKIQNISGKTLYISPAGHNSGLKVRGKTLANNETAEFPDNQPVVTARLQELAAQGLISILSGPSDKEDDGSVSRPASATVTIATAGTTDADTVTVNGVVFEFANDAASVSDPTYIWAGDGAAGATAGATLRTALNANQDLTGVACGALITIGTDTVLPLYAVSGDDVTDGASYTLAKSGTNITVSGAVFADGASGKVSKSAEFVYTVTAADETATKWAIPTGLDSISWFQVQILSAGVALAGSTAVWTVDGGSLVVDDSGLTAMSAGDKVYVQAIA